MYIFTLCTIAFIANAHVVLLKRLHIWTSMLVRNIFIDIYLYRSRTGSRKIIGHYIELEYIERAMFLYSDKGNET